MKKPSGFLCQVVILAALLLVADTPWAQEHTQIYCADCRDPNVHPADFGNAAFNALRTPDNGFTFDEFDVVEVINLSGQWAWVNLEFEMLVLDLGFEIPTFVIPTGNIFIQITDAHGRWTSYVIDLDIPNPLAVGEGIGPGYNPAGGSNPIGSGDAPGGGGYGDSGDGWDPRDYWDGWENGYGGQLPRHCIPDYSDPYETTIVCFR
ncbi:MAG: hypothetical protein WBM45_00730 [Woeseiaceae bacterium]